MGKKVKRCQQGCPRHTFELRPVHYSAYFTREVQASFCPLTFRGRSATPRFNTDRTHFTSCFMLPLEHKKLKDNRECYQMEHDRCTAEHLQQREELYVPKPKSKSAYCNICKAEYEDYLSHINSEWHHVQLISNPFNSDIARFCQKLEKEHCLPFKSSYCDNTSRLPSLLWLPSETSLSEKPTPISLFKHEGGHEVKSGQDTLVSTRSFNFMEMLSNADHADMQKSITNIVLSPVRKECQIVVSGDRKKGISLFGSFDLLHE